MSDPNFPQQAANFGVDAAVDTAADGVINNLIDGVASHIPGGETMDQVLKTGVDLAANNAINAEISNVETSFFGDHSDQPA